MNFFAKSIEHYSHCGPLRVLPRLRPSLSRQSAFSMSTQDTTFATTSRAPLQGIRVLDLTRLLPGPVCTMHLGDLGADVIKIEDLDLGDYAAQSVRELVNRNKRGLRLDLKNEAGRQTLIRLVQDADVLVESFRPGVMERLGVGYETLKAHNPRLIYCSLTGYGHTGPWNKAAGHDMNYTGWTGVLEQMGSSDSGLPALSNVPVADLLGGSLTATMGILAALVDVARTGQGRFVDIAIADGVMAHALIPLASVNTQRSTSPIGQSKLTGAVPCYAIYPTADGRHLGVAAFERKFWDRFCTVMGRDDLQQHHLPKDSATTERVFAELRSLIASQPLAHWQALFANEDCCVSPILKLEESLELEQFQARGMVLPLNGSATQRQFGCPVKMSDFEFAVRHPAPQPGQHTDAVLAEAGLSPEDIAQLRSQVAIG